MSLEFNWKLVRERDGLVKQSRDVTFIEFDDNGRFKERHHEIALNRAIIMSPFNDFYTWQTTEVTEIIKQKKGYWKFKTKNSMYELFDLREVKCPICKQKGFHKLSCGNNTQSPKKMSVNINKPKK